MAGAGAGAMVEEVPTGLAAGAADAMAAKAGQPPGDCTSSRGQLDPGTPSPDLAPGNRQRWERRGGRPGFGAWRKVERKLARPASAQPRAATAALPPGRVPVATAATRGREQEGWVAAQNHPRVAWENDGTGGGPNAGSIDRWGSRFLNLPLSLHQTYRRKNTPKITKGIILIILNSLGC